MLRSAATIGLETLLRLRALLHLRDLHLCNLLAAHENVGEAAVEQISVRGNVAAPTRPECWQRGHMISTSAMQLRLPLDSRDVKQLAAYRRQYQQISSVAAN